jgi:hypothetical protein
MNYEWFVKVLSGTIKLAEEESILICGRPLTSLNDLLKSSAFLLEVIVKLETENSEGFSSTVFLLYMASYRSLILCSRACISKKQPIPFTADVAVLVSCS